MLEIIVCVIIQILLFRYLFGLVRRKKKSKRAQPPSTPVTPAAQGADAKTTGQLDERMLPWMDGKVTMGDIAMARHQNTRKKNTSEKRETNTDDSVIHSIYGYVTYIKASNIDDPIFCACPIYIGRSTLKNFNMVPFESTVYISAGSHSVVDIVTDATKYLFDKYDNDENAIRLGSLSYSEYYSRKDIKIEYVIGKYHINGKDYIVSNSLSPIPIVEMPLNNYINL